MNAPDRIWKDKWSWYPDAKPDMPVYIRVDLVNQLKGYTVHKPDCDTAPQDWNNGISGDCTCGLTKLLSKIGYS